MSIYEPATAALVAVVIVALGAAYLVAHWWDTKTHGELPKADPPSNCNIVAGPWLPRSIPEDES